MSRYIILLFFWSLAMLTVRGQEPPAAYRHHFGHVMSLHFSEADSYLNTNSRLDAKSQAYRYHLADYRHFLEVFIEEEEDVYDEALEQREVYIDFWESLPDHVPERDYFLGDTYLRWALLRLKFNQKFRAALELNRAYRLLRSTIEEHPGFLPAKADMGVMEVFIGTVPERYRWVLDLLNFQGTVQEGKKKIDEVLRASDSNERYAYLQVPTLFMRSFIDMNISGQVEPGLLRRLEQLDEEGAIAEQPLMVFLYAGLLQKQRQNSEALTILNYYDIDSEEVPFYYLYYMKGLSQLYAMDEACLSSFRRFAGNFKGRHYLKAAHQKIGWYYLLQGDTMEYRRAMTNVISFGEAVTGADEQALQEAESGTIPSVPLLKSRLLFDGGYYNDALEVLENYGINTGNIIEQTEWFYRKGRILHQLEQYDAAVALYERAYQSGKDLEEYYAANAMLMTGRIYLKLGNIPGARKAFNQCLDLSGFQYQYSIHQKAKAGLSETESD